VAGNDRSYDGDRRRQQGRSKSDYRGPDRRKTTQDRGDRRSSRGSSPSGRRRSDYLQRSAASRKAIAVIVVVVDALYLVGDALITGSVHCL